LINEEAFIHKTACVDQGAAVGAHTKVWHFCHIMPRATVGEYCVLGQNVFVGDNVIIGNSVKIQNNVSVYEGVILRDEAFIGPSAVFTNVINPRSHVERKDEYKQTVVGKGATIGANATIICGNRIGEYAMVGAGAVVTGNVADFSLVVGNPARRIGWMSRAGHRLPTPGKNGVTACPETGEKYRITDENLILIS